MNFPESDVQFLARCIIQTREGEQMASKDAQRLSNLAQYGDSLPRGEDGVTTMPEERRSDTPTRSPEGVVRD